MQRILVLGGALLGASAFLAVSAAHADGDLCSANSIRNVIESAALAATCNPDNVLTTEEVLDIVRASVGEKRGAACTRAKNRLAKKIVPALKLLGFGADAIADFQSKLAALPCAPGVEPSPSPVPSASPGTPLANAIAQINLACPKQTMTCDQLVPCYITQIKSLHDSQGLSDEDSKRLLRALLENADCERIPPAPSPTPPGLSTNVDAAYDSLINGCVCAPTQPLGVYGRCVVGHAEALRLQYTADTIRKAFMQAMSRNGCGIPGDDSHPSPTPSPSPSGEHS